MRAKHAVLPFLLGLALAVQATAQPTRPAPKELRFCLWGDPSSLDPLHVSDQFSETVRYLTSGVLLRVNRANGKIEPELAESWKIGDGGRSITFHLRAGLKFSDGATLTSADVARTLRAALDPKRPSPAGDAFRSEKGDPEIQELSPLEILVRFPSPRPAIEQPFDSLSIVPATSAKLPPSAGPFFVAEYLPGDHLRLARNPNYWKRDAAGVRLPYLDSIRLDIQPNRDIELARFLRGEIHLVNRVDPDSFDRLAKQQPAAAKNLGASLDSEFLWFNQAPSPANPEWKRKWFTSVNFRRAISTSIHREDVARIVYRGHAHPAAGPLSPSNKFWFNAALKPLTYDSAMASKLLAADGFTLQGGKLKDRDGHPVEFSIITNSGNRAREAVAAVIQDDLKKIGIVVNIVTLDFGSLVERISRTAQYEACLLGFTNVGTDPIEQMDVWLSSSAQHAWWPAQKSPGTPWEARIDQLELAQASEPARDRRKKAVDEVQKIVMEQEPIVYLVNPDYLSAIAPSLRGLQPAVDPPQILWNIEWLRLE